MSAFRRLVARRGNGPSVTQLLLMFGLLMVLFIFREDVGEFVNWMLQRVYGHAREAFGG